MNTVTRTLLPLTLLTTISAGTLRCMDLPRTLTPLALSTANSAETKGSMNILPMGIFPQEIKYHIVSFCLGAILGYDFLPFKSLLMKVPAQIIEFSPDGKTVLTRSEDKTACLWDISSGKQLQEFKGHRDAARSVAFSPDGKTVLTASAGTARLWNVSTRKHLQDFIGHSGLVNSVAYSPDGRTVLTGSEDKTACLWDPSTGKQLQVFKGHGESIFSVAYSPDGRTILTGSSDKTAILWDLSTGKQLQVLKGHTDEICSVAFSPDGNSIGTGSTDKSVILWKRSYDSGTWAKTRKESALDLFMGFYPVLMSFSEEQKISALVASETEYSMKILPMGTLPQEIKYHITSLCLGATLGYDFLPFKELVTEGHARRVVFSPDGKTVLIGSILIEKNNLLVSDSTACLWDVSSGKQLQELIGHTDWISSVAFSPDGKTLLAGSRDSTTAYLLDVLTGKQLQELGHTLRINSVAFSPDGKTVLTGSRDYTARLWDVSLGKQLQVFKGHTNSVSSVVFSPDGQTVITGSFDKTARLWNVETGKGLRVFKGHTKTIRSVAFSPDGQTVLTGSWDTTACLWDISSGKRLQEFIGHIRGVISVAYSPDGKTVLTGSDDNTARLWDVSSGKQLQVLKGHTDEICSVAFSPDGNNIATGSTDKSVILWKRSYDSGTWAKTRKESALELFMGFYPVLMSFSEEQKISALVASENEPEGKMSITPEQNLNHEQKPTALLKRLNLAAFSPRGNSSTTSSKDSENGPKGKISVTPVQHLNPEQNSIIPAQSGLEMQQSPSCSLHVDQKPLAPAALVQDLNPEQQNPKRQTLEDGDPEDCCIL